MTEDFPFILTKDLWKRLFFGKKFSLSFSQLLRKVKVFPFSGAFKSLIKHITGEVNATENGCCGLKLVKQSILNTLCSALMRVLGPTTMIPRAPLRPQKWTVSVWVNFAQLKSSRYGPKLKKQSILCILGPYTRSTIIKTAITIAHTGATLKHKRNWLI